MASQITHIPYGKKVLDLFLSDQKVDHKKFFIGTLFPDIRYLGVLERDKSHPQNPIIENIMNLSNDFEKGVYTHALIDIERERILQKSGIYELVGHSPFTTYAMKYIEDEYTFNLIPDWSLYQNYLNSILDEEIALVNENSVKKWHEILRGFFQKPTWLSAENFARQLPGYGDDIFNKIKNEIVNIKNNQEATNIISQTYDHLFKI